MKSSRNFILSVMTVAGVAVLISATGMAANVTLRGDNATRDAVWVKEDWSQNAWVIHKDETLYRITTAKMVWAPFNGTTSDYTLRVKVYAKSNGSAPIWMVVDGVKVWEGSTPLPAGLTRPRCCGTKNTRDCGVPAPLEGPVWIETGKKITVKNGARVEFWGKTAYYCQPSGWTSGTTLTGYGGGTYAGFYEIELVGQGTVALPPVLSLASSTLSFSMVTGSTAPQTKTVAVINKGGGTLPTLKATESASWLSTAVQGSGNSQQIAATVDVTGLAVGTHTAKVSVSGLNMQTVSFGVTLTVTARPVPPITLIYPNGGQSFKIGDSITITWRTDETRSNIVDLYITIDAGKTYRRINGTQSVDRSDPRWSNFGWKIPPSLESVSLTGNLCKIKVVDYLDATLSDISDASFSIIAPTSTIPRKVSARNAHLLPPGGTKDEFRTLSGARTRGNQCPGVYIVPGNRNAVTTNRRSSNGRE